MPIAATDLKLLGAASRPEDDASTTGGDEVLTSRPLDSQFSAAAVAALISSAGGDTMNVTVYGRDAAGNLVSETKALNGTSEVLTTQSFERITKVVIASTATGTVLLKQGTGGTTRHTFAPGELSAFIMFLNAASDPSSGKTFYEKLHWTNAHASLDLQSAAVKLTADPDSKFEIGVAAAVNDTTTVANRLSAPGGITFVDDNVSQSVPGGVLAHGAEVGVWIKMTLGSGAAAAKSTFTLQLDGTTT